MANQPAKNSPEDEIDLGQLFQLIGKGFSKLFDFIAGIFKGIFHIFILGLLFIQKHFIVLVSTTIVGGILGFVLDNMKTEKFESKMVVEPNFNSVQQLYNNIGFYNDLAAAKDSFALASALKISPEEASSIRKIFVDSYTDENQKIQLFDSFIRKLDSTTVKALDYDSFMKNFNSMDARFHQISVVATDNRVAKKIQPAIIGSISANNYFKLQKRINDENLVLQDTILRKQLTEIDSLEKIYQTVLLKEAEKPMQGTNINLAENGQSQNKELALVQERETLKNRLVTLNQEKANKATILNVISDFPSRGVKQKGFLYSYKLFMPVFSVLFVLLFLLMLSLNKNLKRYKLENQN
ncbi:MAG: hypothetical protein HKO09_01575 [Croceitalea sp.]|nr:hypothetical protein [Croceitalea sp.]